MSQGAVDATSFEQDAPQRNMNARAYIVRSGRLRAELLLLAVFAYIILSTGKVFSIGGVSILPLYTVFFILLTFVLITNNKTLKFLNNSLIILCPYAILLILSSSVTNYPWFAFEKIDGAIFSSLIAAIIIFHMLQKYGELKSLYAIAFTSFIILLLTFLYKLQFGLFDRGVRFFINGPIVFGWIMGINALICLYLYTCRTRRFLVSVWGTIFFLALIWTQSKGPFIATASVAALMLIVQRSFHSLLTLAIIALLALTSFSLFPGEITQRYTAIIRVLSDDLTESDAGSIAVRIESWKLSLELFRDNILFGVGLANWGEYNSTPQIISHLTYPHNIFFETLSESGLAAFISLVLIILYVFVCGGPFARYLILFFGLCLSFSGDISYLRFLLSYPLAAAGIRAELRRKRVVAA